MIRRTRLGIYGLAVTDGRVLLARVSKRVPGGAGKWTLPGGGMHWGETPEATLDREMYEETGLSGRIGRLLMLRSFPYDESDTEYHLLQAVYSIEVQGEPRVTEVDGSVDLSAWHAIEDLPRIPTTRLFESTRDFW